ncbi:hypothetical protein MH117_14905 [Paenibacillus sp. ACRRX]|uniref:hypothetical protein n=1 Tax=Paenibacillus sp. ACRRX TaxID=2918206 RepID=UPI001EF6D963|nr:hypothetical protein [Paenibacillus sp. ACRRX]MCG7408719.1 hypothetical protein [Paenibacillus sp. ACRRX]
MNPYQELGDSLNVRWKRDDSLIALIDNEASPINAKLSTCTTYDVCANKNEPEHPLSSGNPENRESGIHSAQIIRQVVPNLNMHIAKLAHMPTDSSSSLLLKALEEMSHTDVRIIYTNCMTTDRCYERDLKEVCETLARQGKILIYPFDDCTVSFSPAISSSVIGVCGSSMKRTYEYWYNPCSPFKVVADATPTLVPNAEGHYVMFGGHRKAAALFCGIVTKIVKTDPHVSNRTLMKLLRDLAARTEWVESQHVTCIPHNENIAPPCGCCYNDYLLSEMIQLLSDHLQLSRELLPNLCDHSLLHPQIGLKPDMCVRILKAIEQKFSIKLNFNAISLHHFYSIYTLLDLIDGASPCYSHEE